MPPWEAGSLFPGGTFPQRGPDALQLDGNLGRDARPGRLRVPIHPRELARAQRLARQQGFASGIEQLVVGEVDVVAIARTAPVRSFVPVGERAARSEQAARLAPLAEHEEAVAAADLFAARATPSV